MRGAGGPLLCIGDLLSDVREEEDGVGLTPKYPFYSSSSESSVSFSDLNLQPRQYLPGYSPELGHVHFEMINKANDGLESYRNENYDQLSNSLTGTDHSWTSLTLKLCSAVDTANKLVQSTNTEVELLSEKLVELDRILKRGDSAIESAKAIHNSLKTSTKETKADGKYPLITQKVRKTKSFMLLPVVLLCESLIGNG